ncbi:glycosyltransferase [Winslowiella sp. 2C04]|uniref:glycosyltransferase n=1 Tax=Winslowiella sp. 2C04 TaxID=3416179 RepID=UPI003CF1D324
MKVLHAAETIKGGVATVLKQIASSQINRNAHDKIICIVPDSQRKELDCIADKNIVTFKRNRRDISAFIAFARVFTKKVWQEKPDFVHLHSTFAGVLARVVLLLMWPVRRPTVIYCPHAFSFLMVSTPMKRKVYILIEKILLGITDKVVCVSDFEYQEGLKAGLNEDKLTTIYNGVPVKLDRVKKGKTDKVNLLFVGRFDLQKGYDVLINAYRQCNKEDFTLTIVGDSVNHQNEKVELENVTYTGWLAAKDIESYFIAADALVIPSRWEGFAMVPLEAMSYSLPVISSNSTSLPEVVIDGETGFLFDNGDVNALANILSNLKKYDLVEMGRKGNKFFNENFTSQSMIDKTNELYSILKSSNK